MKCSTLLVGLTIGFFVVMTPLFLVAQNAKEIPFNIEFDAVSQLPKNCQWRAYDQENLPFFTLSIPLEKNSIPKSIEIKELRTSICSNPSFITSRPSDWVLHHDI